jgi:hypothetical protein
MAKLQGILAVGVLDRLEDVPGKNGQALVGLKRAFVRTDVEGEFVRLDLTATETTALGRYPLPAFAKLTEAVPGSSVVVKLYLRRSGNFTNLVAVDAEVTPPRSASA